MTPEMTRTIDVNLKSKPQTCEVSNAEANWCRRRSSSGGPPDQQVAEPTVPKQALMKQRDQSRPGP